MPTMENGFRKEPDENPSALSKIFGFLRLFSDFYRPLRFL